MTTKRLFFTLLPLAIFLAGVVLYASAINFRSQTGCPCVNREMATGEFQMGAEEAYFEGEKIFPPMAALPELAFEDQQVLGEATEAEKWIEVDLSEQKLRAWEGSNLFLETLISSGKPWTPTIKGEFRIWSKFRYAKMSGGNRGQGNYYYLPNVPYIMYFHRDYGLHGTYWHANFGMTMSHGCVNLPTPIAEKLFYWTTPSVTAGKNMAVSNSENLGTRVVVHD